MENIILTGMPGCGKSTVGVVLAKVLGYNFLDTDLLLQTMQQKKLQEILDTQGLNAFRQYEEQALLSVTQTENVVIATGGSAVYSDAGMKHLKRNGICVFLDTPYPILKQRIGDMKTRGIAFSGNQTLKELFEERQPLYRKYADFIIPSDQASPYDTATEIKQRLLSK